MGCRSRSCAEVLLPDVNVLVAAHRDAHPLHDEARSWLVGALDGEDSVALSLPTVSGFVRVSTSRRVFDPPGTQAEAFGFIRALAAHRATLWLNPGRQHLVLLESLCASVEARGDLVSDAVIAALAVEAGATVVSYDRDFALFPRVAWERPA